MSIKFGIFDIPLGGDPAKYCCSGDEMRDIFRSMLTNGIVPELRQSTTNNILPTKQLGSSLSANAGQGLNITINKGIGWIDGGYCIVTQPEVVPVQPGWINDIVLRLDLTGSDVVYGFFAKHRSAGTIEAGLTREGGVYELGLQSVNVPANSTQVTANMITDYRLNMSNGSDGLPCCGITGSLFMPDIDAWYQSATQKQKEWMDDERGLFNTWFETIKNILSGDVAGNLLNLINNHKDDMQSHISVLTHTRTGTSNPLAGTLPTTGMCVRTIKPTHDCVAGDTYTINGVTYTAQTTGGEPLEDGMFKANVALDCTIDVDGKKINFKVGGGSAKFNIFTGLTPPDKTDGIWLKGNLQIDKTVFTQFTTSEGQWTDGLANMPTARTHLGSSAVENIIYAIGGMNQDHINSSVNEAYDTKTNLWSNKAPIPEPLAYVRTVSVGSCIYVMQSNSQGKQYVYDTKTNLWSTLLVSDALRYLFRGAVSAVGNIIYIIGGRNNDSCLNTNYAYDTLTKLHSLVAPMPTARESPQSNAVGNVIYVMGGAPRDANGTKNNEAYDTKTNLWTTKREVIYPVDTEQTSCAVGTVIYYNTNYGFIAYDTLMDSWFIKTALYETVFRATASAVGNIIYLIGGSDGQWKVRLKNLNAYSIKGDIYPANTAVIQYGYGKNKAGLYKDKKFDIPVYVGNCYYHDGTSLKLTGSATNINNQGWSDVI